MFRRFAINNNDCFFFVCVPICWQLSHCNSFIERRNTRRTQTFHNFTHKKRRRNDKKITKKKLHLYLLTFNELQVIDGTVHKFGKKMFSHTSSSSVSECLCLFWLVNSVCTQRKQKRWYFRVKTMMKWQRQRGKITSHFLQRSIAVSFFSVSPAKPQQFSAQM